MRSLFVTAVVAALLIAGCSGAPNSSDSAPTSTVSMTSTGPSPAAVSPVAPPTELHNRSYALSPSAPPAPGSFTVDQPWATLNVTASPWSTSGCFYMNGEFEANGTYVEPGLYLTSPSGNQTMLAYPTPTGCNPLNPPQQRGEGLISLTAEQGEWTFRVRGTGANAEVRVTVQAA